MNRINRERYQTALQILVELLNEPRAQSAAATLACIHVAYETIMTIGVREWEKRKADGKLPELLVEIQRLYRQTKNAITLDDDELIHKCLNDIAGTAIDLQFELQVS